MNKQINLTYKQVVGIITSNPMTAQAWIEDPLFRKIHTPATWVFEISDGWKYFEAVDPSVPLIHVHTRNAEVVSVIDHLGISYEIGHDESWEFIELVRQAIETHDLNCHYWHGRDMSETLGFTITKR